MKCEVCGDDRASIAKLSRHIRDAKHGISSKEYYDRFLKSTNDGKCAICTGETRFITLGDGYKKTCSHKCGGIWHRRKLKSDPEKNSAFIQRVAQNQSQIWAKREETGEAEEIHSRVGKTISVQRSMMTYEERQQKFGWMNKLSSEEKKQKVEEIISKSLRLWHSENKVIHDEDRWWGYSARVRVLTERTYKKFKTSINPMNHARGRDKYHLDHRLSVLDGFLNDVPAEIVASVCNLEMLTALENMTKHSESSITPEELMRIWHILK